MNSREKASIHVTLDPKSLTIGIIAFQGRAVKENFVRGFSSDEDYREAVENLKVVISHYKNNPNLEIV